MKVALVLTLTLFLVDIAALTSKFQDDVTHIKRSNRECFYIFKNSILRPCFLHKKRLYRVQLKLGREVLNLKSAELNV